MNGRRGQGFTLIELIIALALIGMALAIGFAALRLAARSMESTDRLVNELEELRVARAVAQRQLAQARPLRESSTEQQVNFQGESQQLEFVAPAPVQGERLMGLYRYRLRFAAAGEEQKLMLDYQPYAPGAVQDWSVQSESTQLVGDVREGEFSYFGAAKGEVEGWQNNWQKVERMPRMVRIVMIRSVAPDEPLEIVVALPVERGR